VAERERNPVLRYRDRDLEPVCIACHDPAEAFRLQKILETEGYEAHRSRQPPANASPSLVVYGPEDLSPRPPTPPSRCSAVSTELQLARAAL
jgi:hypothetical protein